MADDKKKPEPPKNPKRDYIVTVDGFVAGKRRKTGDPVQLTARQALYEHVTLARETAPEERKKTSAKK